MTTIQHISRIGFVSFGALVAFFFVSSISATTAHAAFTSEMQLGSKSADVTQLQQFLSTNSFIYPSGIVTGYFGPLTKAAVVQFQVAYDISQVGRVGPQTMAKMNDILSSGFGLDTTAPLMQNASVQTNRTGATINWTTGDLARGQVFYDTTPIRSDEAIAHAQQPFISGTAAVNNSDVRNNQAVAIGGLNPNTTYYYLSRAIDNAGNVTMSLSNSFRTDQ